MAERKNEIIYEYCANSHLGTLFLQRWNALARLPSTVLLALDEYATFFNAVWTSAGGGALALSPDTDRLQKTATG